MKRSALFSIFIILVILFSAGIGYCFIEAYKPETPTEQKADNDKENKNDNTSNEDNKTSKDNKKDDNYVPIEIDEEKIINSFLNGFIVSFKDNYETNIQKTEIKYIYLRKIPNIEILMVKLI